MVATPCLASTCSRRRTAFTLFELIVVMAIIIIIMGIAVPTLLLNNLHDDTKVQGAVDTVKARWADCRTHAIEEGQMYRFAVVPNTGKFKIEPCDAMGNPTLNGPPEDENAGIVMEDRLPTGVRFGTKDMPVSSDGPENDGSDYVAMAIFLPDGTAQSDVEVTFGGAGTVTTLRLNALTGATSVIRQSEGN